MGISTSYPYPDNFFVVLVAAGVRINCLSTVLFRVVNRGLPE